MSSLKKGDIVTRTSYGNDVLFSIERIIELSQATSIAILKGITIRIKADAPIDDLRIATKERIKENINSLENRIEGRINQFLNLERKSIHYGKILHLDGDKKYSDKSIKYYKKLGLTATVKNIRESKQPLVIGKLLQSYKPDILVITRT